MQLLYRGKRRTLTVLRSFLLFALLAFAPPGCGFKSWLLGPYPEDLIASQSSLAAPPTPPESQTFAVSQGETAQPSEARTETPQAPRQTSQTSATSPLGQVLDSTALQATRQTLKTSTTAEGPSSSAPEIPSGNTHDWLPGFLDGQKEVKSNPQYVTEEDLLKVVGEVQRVASKDTYRFPIAKDVTGANVYKATLTRLQDYEAKHPGAYPEIIAFTRARAYEGLHEYDKALAQYQIVGQTNNRLSAEATKAIDVLTRFQEIKQRPITATTPLEYLQTLDAQIGAWQELQKHYAGSAYAALAREEEERLDWAKVAFLELNRHSIEDGNQAVVIAYRQLIGKHGESKNFYRYQIEFGDFYVTLAQEYAAQNDPQSLQFDSYQFEELGRAALRLYAQVAQEDGVIEKLEAKGKLQALEAYMAKIGRLGR